MRKYYDYYVGWDFGGGSTPKPYFLKWLPVEGEIKKGDEVITNHGKGTFRGMRSHGAPATGYEERPYVWIYETESTNAREECLWDMKNIKLAEPKLKLFVCTRDNIQVGDTIYTHAGDGGDVVISMNNNEIQTRRGFSWENIDSTLFKVIGEVSPDALEWVKQGMEFSEDQVEKGYINQHGEFFSGWFEQGYPITVRLKCPCCKKFI